MAEGGGPDSDWRGQQLRHCLRLSMVEGVGPRIRKALLERFGSPEAVLAAAPSELREVSGVGQKVGANIAAAVEEIDVEAEIALCGQRGVTILLDTDPGYPQMLGEIVDPPGVLYVRGTIEPCDGVAVAVVGTRHATQYGLKQAQRLGASLARAGLTVVSGLARGIDAAAHRGALSAGGRTLAVLGSGVLNVYPPEHQELAGEVMARGALLGEAPPRAAPQSGCFPQRNRIISGLCLGTVIVEAGQRSGALITARHSGEQNREVFAVPGRVDSRTSCGCHRLIRDGAKLVETVDDVLEELGPLVAAVPREEGPPIRHPAELLLNTVETRVLGQIDTEPTSIDRLVSATGLPAGQVLSTLTVLEMRRLVRRVGGAAVVRL